MCEGDLLAFADGITIIALGKAVSPPARMNQFDLDYDSGDEYLFRDEKITGCRAEIILLNEEDCFTYKKRSRFCGVKKPEMRDSIATLWAQYTKMGDPKDDTEGNDDAENPTVNLFHWANKELSQDAFLCWLIQWASKEHAAASGILHEIGRKLVEALISKSEPFVSQSKPFILPEQSTMTIFKQYLRLDLAVRIETPSGNYALLIEDKVNAEIYNDLAQYRSILEKDEHFKNCEFILPILIKTGDQCSYIPAESAGFKTFLRKDFLNFLAPYRQQCKSNSILDNFYSHLSAVEEEVESFRNLPIGSWQWNSWKGFYNYLSRRSPFIVWHYVPNKSGGFLCSRSEEHWLGDLGILYWQIEHDKKRLCLKLGEVRNNPSSIREQAIAIVDEYLAVNALDHIDPPERKGCGCYMTIKVVKAENWLGRDDDMADLDEIVKRLARFASLTEKIIAHYQTMQ